MFETNSPKVLWCYYIEKKESVINANIRVKLLPEGKLPHFRLTGQPTDISSIFKFGWFDWVVYCVEGNKTPLQHQRLVRSLGTSKDSESVMSQWLLTGNGDIMPIQMLRHLMPAERIRPVMLKWMNKFDDNAKKKFCDIMSIPIDQSLYSNMYP